MVLAGSICSILFVACDKDDDADRVNGADRDFVMMASLSNNAEIGAGQVAANKATNPLVKAFGQHMVDSHVPAQADLKSRAATYGIVAPDTLDAEHRALMARLNSLSGYSFDTAYMNSQVKDHAKTLLIFDTELSNGVNPSIRGYAADKRSHIQEHFVKADSIRRVL